MSIFAKMRAVNQWIGSRNVGSRFLLPSRENLLGTSRWLTTRFFLEGSREEDPFRFLLKWVSGSSSSSSSVGALSISPTTPWQPHRMRPPQTVGFQHPKLHFWPQLQTLKDLPPGPVLLVCTRKPSGQDQLQSGGIDLELKRIKVKGMIPLTEPQTHQEIRSPQWHAKVSPFATDNEVLPRTDSIN